ncbi:MAG: hypothetical protein HN353_02655 [Bdellovibrionales bacterium]|nr:hypothetical protein [Bdellovibrionales bacterium]MBT3525587.1 hypothetical protein [Bdellovibrionales bacterium]MBT7765678.1 hypothetical protein [Bdellovibrionales bacterium]
MFPTEDDLVSAFKHKSKMFLQTVCNRSVSRHFIIPEFDSYTGVADLILGTYRPYLSKKNNREIVNLNWLFPLTNFEEGQIFTVQEFMEKYNFSKSSARLKLKEYIDAGFLQKLDNRSFEVIRKYNLICDEVIAVEAKLKNWKRALTQAIRYKKISDYSFVLLDESYASSALSNIELFNHHNIGLITMNKSKFVIHTSPEKKNIKKAEYFIRVNEAAYGYFSMTECAS